jgi:hypothetical protein
MDEPHKQLVTTSPVALKKGQSRLHIADEHPWHRIADTVECPKCETVFILTGLETGRFPKEQLLALLEKHHEDSESHPDFIASDPAFTDIADCDCQKKKTKPAS